MSQSGAVPSGSLATFPRGRAFFLPVKDEGREGSDRQAPRRA